MAYKHIIRTNMNILRKLIERFFPRGETGTTGDLLASPTDNRDYALSSFMPPIVRYPEKKLNPFNLNIHDQSIFPSCVGMTCATIKEGNELLEMTHRIFDGKWIYDECKKIDGIPDVQGTYFRTGLKVLKDTGAKPMGKDEDPLKYRVKAYARVDDMSFEGLKKALSMYHYVLAGFRGTNEGWRRETIRPPRQGETEWGHAVALTGYDKDYLYGQNSWGEWSWVHGGSGGTFKTTKDYLPFEAWVVILDAPNEVGTIQDEIVGYVASEFVQIKNGQIVATHNLRLRQEPTTKSKSLLIYQAGTPIKTTMEFIKRDGYNWIPVLK